MSMPLQITFHEMDASDAVRAKIEELVERLSELAGDATACRVTVEPGERRRHAENRYLVKIHLNLPGREFEASGDSETGDGHEDVYVAVNRAFDAIKRQIVDYAGKQRARHRGN